MNKKLIRLTEQDLHKIVKESVSKVLTELDWKTYANAAKLTNGRQFRSFDFADKAAEEFNKKHKLGDDNTFSDGEWDMYTDGLEGDDILKSIPWDPDIYGDVENNKYLKTYTAGDLPINLSHIDKVTPKRTKYTDIEWTEDFVDDDGYVKNIKRKDKVPSECLKDKECLKYLPSNFTITGEHYEDENDYAKSYYTWNPYNPPTKLSGNPFDPRNVDNPDYGFAFTPSMGKHKKEKLKKSATLNKALKQNHEANKDFNDYLYGKSKYIKGKGWVEK